MSERRFYIRELADYEYQDLIKEQYTVTESELKRRLALIAPQDLTYHDGENAVTDEDIDILLKGTSHETKNEQ